VSFEWAVIRPCVLAVMIFVAAASWDFIALGALSAFLVGQAIIVGKSIADGNSKVLGSTAEESNVFFLANNVVIIVKSRGRLFVDACSSLGYKKVERPVFVEVCSTVIFMAGVLLVGIAGFNFKVAYLTGHAVQAILLAFRSRRMRRRSTVNGINWNVKPVKALAQRRDGYVWVTEETTGNTDWLSRWQLANAEVLQWVQDRLVQRTKVFPNPAISHH
jgi:hypothetical protein